MVNTNAEKLNKKKRVFEGNSIFYGYDLKKLGVGNSAGIVSDT